MNKNTRPSSPKSVVPPQRKGAKTDSRARKKLTTINESRALFNEAKRRLYNINSWKDYCGQGSGEFFLTDHSGKQIFTKVKVGDLIKIELPAPGNKTGNGYEWVRIEAIEEKKDITREWEFCSIRVRPTDNPLKASKDTAHFYTSDATSTFEVERTGMIITAAEHGRNEVPNTKVENPGDKIRNAVVALGAMVGLAKVQWKKLTKGLLDLKTKAE